MVDFIRWAIFLCNQKHDFPIYIFVVVDNIYLQNGAARFPANGVWHGEMWRYLYTRQPLVTGGYHITAMPSHTWSQKSIGAG